MLDSRMHKLFYERHRQRVESAKSEVEHDPPVIHAGNYVQLSKLRDDHGTYLALQSKKYETLVKINQCERTRGIINSFAPATSAKFVRSKLYNINLQLKEIEKVNEEIGQRLITTKPEISTHHTKEQVMSRRRSDRPPKPKKKEPTFILPQEILQKYEGVNLPKDEDVLHKLLRPKIFFEVEMEGTRPLGRIIMELYTEACPEVVLEFVRVCQTHNADDCLQLVRSFPQLWLEGELHLKNAKIHTKNVEYDMRALDHGNSEGILSIPHENLKGFPLNLIPFTISYKPLRVANGNRLAFGKVIAGLKNLYSLKDYGTKNGKPSRDMKIKNCGTLPQK